MVITSWFLAHWLTIFTVWVALHTLTSVAAANVPPTTWYGKLAHVWVALNPMDVMKAIQTVGASLAVPVSGLLLCFGVAVAGGNLGCSLFASSTPQTSAQVQQKAQAQADATLALIKDAWEASAEGCLAVANAAHDDTIRQKCEPVLTGIRNGFLGAQSMVDTWNAVDQANFPCAVNSIVNGFFQFQALLPNLAEPASVRDMLILARGFLGQCPTDDGVQ